MQFSFHQERGVSLVIVLFVMIIIVAVVLATTAFLYNTIRLVRNMSYSVSAFYAADSGIEKLLYYDRMVAPEGEDVRGVCLMCSADGASCPGNALNEGLNCACQAPVGNDCDPLTCTDCTVTFATDFDGRSYTIRATVYPDQDPYDMEIRSSGVYNNVGRALSVSTTGDE